MSLPPLPYFGWFVQKIGKPPTKCRWCEAKLDIYRNGWRACRDCDKLFPTRPEPEETTKGS